jgi:Dockerin type I domain
VNDAPSFTLGGAQAATDEDGRSTVAPTTITGFAANASAGPANESSQTLHFSVVNDNNALFSQQPTVDDATGNLIFKPAPNAHGVANVTVTLQDSGGTAPGVNSVSHTFQINISKPHVLHNVKSKFDVNNDGKVAPSDIIAIINYINSFGAAGAAVPNAHTGAFGPPYLDVTGDNNVVAGDALAVINYVNANGGNTAGPEGESSGSGGAEGEASADSFFADLGSFQTVPTSTTSVVSSQSPQDSMNDLIALLANDSFTEQAKRRRV